MKVQTRRTSVSQSTLERYYKEGYASWDIGKPQKSVQALLASSTLQDPVLDLGCGTGEHAFMLAAKGLSVTAVDISPTAIQMAERKASQRRAKVHFVRADALKWKPEDDTRFGTVLDVGMFHCLGDADVPKYQKLLTNVMRPGAELILLCLAESPHEGAEWPHHYDRKALRALFAPPTWEISAISAALDESTFSPRGFKALLMHARFRGLPE